MVGVGFGPSNLALAIALAEHNRAGPDCALTSRFIERLRRRGGGDPPGARPDGTVRHVEVVLSQSDGTLARHRARKVVLATGLTPYLPPEVDPGERVWHSCELLHRQPELTAEPRPVVVIGAGQSAAEVTNHLHSTFRRRRSTRSSPGTATAPPTTPRSPTGCSTRRRSTTTSSPLTADLVVYATGYRSTDPLALLGESAAWQRDDAGRLRVHRDYRASRPLSPLAEPTARSRLLSRPHRRRRRSVRTPRTGCPAGRRRRRGWAGWARRPAWLRSRRSRGTARSGCPGPAPGRAATSARSTG